MRPPDWPHSRRSNRMQVYRCGQVIEQPDPGVDPERRPLLDRRVEAAGREHQQRRSRADHLVARCDAVDGRGRHGVSLPDGRSALDLAAAHARRHRRAERVEADPGDVGVGVGGRDLEPLVGVADGGMRHPHAAVEPGAAAEPAETGIATAPTTAAPATGPELVKSISDAPASSRSFASATSCAVIDGGAWRRSERIAPHRGCRTAARSAA